MKRKKPYTRIHPDYHLPADIDAGRNFNGSEYIASLKRVGAEAVAFFAKCHYGHSYYYTEVGNRHPRLRCDMLKEVSDGCQEHDMYLTAYFSVFLDTAAVHQHPDWRIISSVEKHGAGFDSGNFRAVCVNSPYLKELFLPQTVEVAENYVVDEMFYDTMSRFTPCFCDNCREKFGKDIPTSEDDPSWHEYVRWYKESFDEFFALTAQTVHEANPDLDCSFNWKWGIREPATPPPGITNLISDFPPSPNRATKHCRYYAGTGLPFDYMSGRFLHGLSEWDNNTDMSMLSTTASTIANGGGYYIIDRHLPDGTLENRSYEMMNTVFSFVNKRRDVIENIKHVPEIAVIYSIRSLYGNELVDFPRAAVQEDKKNSIEGVVNMFSENGIHYTLLSEENIRKTINDYALIIVPEQNELEPETGSLLSEYVENGGTVIISQTSKYGSPSSAIQDLAGISFEGLTELEYGYTGTELPFHTKEKFSMIKPKQGTETLFPYIEPLKAGEGGKKFGHGMAPPGEVSEYSAVTLRKTGRGKVVYIAYPAFMSYRKRQSFHLRNMVFGIINDLFPNPIAKAETEAMIELVSTRKGNDLIINIVNQSGKENLTDYFFPVTEYMPTITDITVSVLGDIEEADLRPDGITLKGETRDDRTEFAIPELKYMESLVIKDYFQNE